MRRDGEGGCDQCAESFSYCLIHNGFNESCYAYCSTCGMTAIIDTLYQDRSAEGLPPHRRITPSGAQHLAACSCGGKFEADAGPRCPHCMRPLSAVHAAEWIEANAPGTRKGWRWQRNWGGLYVIVVEDRVVHNPWRDEATAEQSPEEP